MDGELKPNLQKKILAFIHIEKTAGTTISYILRSTYGIRHCGVQPLGKKPNEFQVLSPSDLQFVLKVHPAGLDSIAGHSVTPYAGLDNVVPIQYFTFLRDPIKQCASYYQYLVDRHDQALNFNNWIQDEWPQNMQTKRIAGIADSNAAWQIIEEKKIFVGMLERFDESLHFLKTLFVPDLNIFYQRRNTAPRQALAQELLNKPESMELLIMATEEDRKLYQRVKQELFPSYITQSAQESRELFGEIQTINGKENKIKQLANLIYRNIIYKPALSLAEKFN